VAGGWADESSREDCSIFAPAAHDDASWRAVSSQPLATMSICGLFGTPGS